MRILLTGGAGYIGSACYRDLRRRGIEAFVYDDLSSGNVQAVDADRLYRGDVRDSARLAEVLRAVSADAVMHFASLVSVPESVAQPERYWSVNFDGTRAVLDAMAKAGVPRLVFSSTAAVYDEDNPQPIDEDGRLAPGTPYGASKLAAEWLIRDTARLGHIGAICLRYFNAAGADIDGRHGESRPHESHLIPLAMAAVLGRRPELQVFGDDWPTRDGTCERDYVHVADIAQAHRLACEAIEPGGHAVYNIGAGQGYSVLEVVEACRRVTGRALPYRIADRRAGDPAVLVAGNRRLREQLGWAPKHTSLDSIVDTAWRWHRDHPEGYDG